MAPAPQNLRADAPEKTTPAWHAEPDERVLEAMQTSQGGLSADEAARRLGQCGRNVLPAARRQHPLIRFLKHFHNPLIYFLLAGATAALLLGHVVDAVVIVIVVLVNAVVGFLQEGKAEESLD